MICVVGGWGGGEAASKQLSYGKSGEGRRIIEGVGSVEGSVEKDDWRKRGPNNDGGECGCVGVDMTNLNATFVLCGEREMCCNREVFSGWGGRWMLGETHLPRAMGRLFLSRPECSQF